MKQVPAESFYERVLMPTYERLISPVLKNLPLLLLTWALVSVIWVVANDPVCRKLPMGPAETVVDLAIGFFGKNIVLALMLFYLLVALLFAFRKEGSRVEELQEKFFRPVVVPVLFQLAGLMGAMAWVSGSTYARMLALAITGGIILLALALHNLGYLLRDARSVV